MILKVLQMLEVDGITDSGATATVAAGGADKEGNAVLFRCC